LNSLTENSTSHLSFDQISIKKQKTTGTKLLPNEIEKPAQIIVHSPALSGNHQNHNQLKTRLNQYNNQNKIQMSICEELPVIVADNEQVLNE